MNAAESAGMAVDAVAQDLACGRLVETPQLVAGGRNSRIHRISTQDGKFALKQYFARPGDSRDRLGIEEGALGLMERRGIDAVPRIVALDRSRGFPGCRRRLHGALTRAADPAMMAAPRNGYLAYDRDPHSQSRGDPRGRASERSRSASFRGSRR